MQLKEGADIRGLHILMRPVLKAADKIWRENGRSEGVTITAGLDGIHSAGSWHYYGLAVDLRNHYFDKARKDLVYSALKASLPEYDVIQHDTHLHIEVGNALAAKHGLLT